MNKENLKAAKRLQREVEKKRRAERKLKKDAVLHLRIEGNIMERIKTEATLRDMSISDLVRCYLTERFSDRPTDDNIPDFLLMTTAFSEVTVTNNINCFTCNEMLARGTNAHLAHGPFPIPHLVCSNCYSTLQEQLDNQDNIEQGEE